MHFLKQKLCCSTFWFHYSSFFLWVGVYQHGTSWLAEALQTCPIARASSERGLLQITPQILYLDSGLGSGWTIPKLESSTGEAILFLIWTYASSHCAERWNFSSSSAFLVLCQNWQVFGTVCNFLPAWLRPQFKPKINSPRSVMGLSPQFFTVGMLFFWQCAVLCQTYILELQPKSSTLVKSHRLFPTCFWETFQARCCTTVGESTQSGQHLAEFV